MINREEEREHQDPNDEDASTPVEQERSNNNDGEDHADGGDEMGESPEQRPPQRSSFRGLPLLVFAGCLGIPVGYGLGQVGHDFRVNQASKKADAAAKGKGDEATGPCKAWADTICERMGSEQGYECTHARAASRLLSGSACVQAQESVLAKIEEFKAGRVQCDELFSKVCSDVGPEGKGCEFAMAKAPTFSSEECQQMKRHYSRVLAKVMKRQEGGTLSEKHDEPGADGTRTVPN